MKFLISVRDGYITIGKDKFIKVLEKELAYSIKELKSLNKKFKKNYPGKEILILEFFSGKWRTINI